MMIELTKGKPYIFRLLKINGQNNIDTSLQTIQFLNHSSKSLILWQIMSRMGLSVLMYVTLLNLKHKLLTWHVCMKRSTATYIWVRNRSTQLRRKEKIGCHFADFSGIIWTEQEESSIFVRIYRVVENPRGGESTMWSIWTQFLTKTRRQHWKLSMYAQRLSEKIYGNMVQCKYGFESRGHKLSHRVSTEHNIPERHYESYREICWRK